ncbi:MAG: exonuclease subunit SbcD [Algicola sp.]|nr:exonuclease subunit SbcD [Algicola sp.]
MRIIHTSDWHLGQHFITKSRLSEHQAFLKWLLDQVKSLKVDAIIVAGDIFDTGSPPSYARQLYNQFIVDLQQVTCQLLILGGNHDSVATLNESTNLLACLNTHVIPCVQDTPEKQVLVLNKADGEPGAVVCAIPFVRPRDVLESQAGQSGSEKQSALQNAISDHYQTIYDLARIKAKSFEPALPVIATGHLTTVGVKTTDSVREIYIGTLEAFPSNAFPKADYIALGHIHRAQKVGKTEHIRYSGSPIPLSFDEVGKTKSVYLVDFKDSKLDSVEAVEIPTFQPMQLIKGDLAEIELKLESLRDHEGELPVWLDIEVTTQQYLTDLQRRIEALTADLPVEVLLLRRQKANRQVTLGREAKETLNELNAEQVFEKRLAQEDFQSDEDKARLARVRMAFASIVSEAQAQGDEL